MKNIFQIAITKNTCKHKHNVKKMYIIKKKKQAGHLWLTPVISGSRL